jgi:antitoxin (DNA-binding transcriptional repressor) of toxin-antitoxin stability system
VVLTVHGEPVADIVPHRRRARWLSGDLLRDELAERSADAGLTAELDDLTGQTLDDL